jgi:UDP-2,3-diacylglucosamine pyrophosphatase LpxH
LIIPFARGFWKFSLNDAVNKTFKWIQENSKGPFAAIAKWVLKFWQKSHFEKARQIRGCLKDAGIDVRAIVFGHTHDPDIRPDARDAGIIDADFRYFNTGTWTTVFSEEERIIREEKQFAFVWMQKKDGKLEPTLYRWNDCAKQPEKLILFDHPED